MLFRPSKLLRVLHMPSLLVDAGMRPLLLVLLLVAVHGGELQFTPSEIQLTPAMTDTEALIQVELTNTGSEKLLLQPAGSSCGCFDQTLEKSVLLPGEKTQLSLVYKFKDSVGKVKRTYTVNARKASQPSVPSPTGQPTGKPSDSAVLTINATIPSPLTFSNRAFMWVAGSANDERTAVVTVNEAVEVRDLRVDNADRCKFVKITQQWIPGQRSLIVKVQPTTTDPEVFSPLEFKNLYESYTVSYGFPDSAKRRYERITAIVIAQPDASGKPPAAPTGAPGADAPGF